MAQVFSSLTRRGKPLSSVIVITLIFAVYKARNHFLATGHQGSHNKNSPSTTHAKEKQGKKVPQKVGVNSHFIEQMKRLLPICIPGLFSKESGLLFILATVLIARTWLDIWFSGFNGAVVKAIVSRNRKTFIAKVIFEFGLMMWPMSIVNNSLKLTISALSLCFRERLTKHAHNQYLDGITFYKISNLDNRLQNADQLLTQDIDKFSENLSHLYSDIAKPVVDIFLFAHKLGQAIGNEAPFYMIAYFAISGVLLRAFSPPFGRYTAIEQKLEGDFRYTHSRIITHSEEVAFYGGAEREKEVVNSSFQKIVNHVRKVYTLRFLNGIFDSVLVKYCATMTAYYLLARPVFDPRYATKHMGALNDDPVKLMEDYSRNSSYLINLSQAVGRLILTGRDLTRFAGYTSRVAELFDVLSDVREGKYKRTMVSDKDGASTESQVVDASKMKGKLIIQDGVIIFDKVPIVTPNNDVLLKELSFKVTQGMNTLVSGPNGCGKSSLFRILGNLWPLFGGKLTKPDATKLFYVPQKPYLALGSFRDQVIYPHTAEDAREKGFTDEKLMDLLETVHLSYLVEREGGWDAVQDWADVLSGGEKQRVAMARLFYHQPQFAILDECTSAVSVDIEAIMYEHARKLGITLFTVSHRTSLVRHHEFLLRFDGEGHYEFREMDPEDASAAFGFGHASSYTLKQHTLISMQRSTKPSTQDDEISNIDAHLEYIKRALRWSISDLERFISLLKARMAAEELYIKSLSGISRLSSVAEPEACPYFGQEKSTFELATFQYELSLDKLITSRREFIQAMKTQIDVLVMVRDKQEQRRKTVKQHVADKNMEYINYRTRDFIKVKKMYFGKCSELAFAQQQLHEGNNTPLSSNYDSPEHTPHLPLEEQPRQSMEIDNDTDGSSISSMPDTLISPQATLNTGTTASTITSTTANSASNAAGVVSATGGNRKKMGGFMAQMRTQLAAATAGANDLSKQNARFAKIKKDIHDADHDYRQGVRYLEHLRKAQIETMNHAMKNVEVVFLDKAEATRSVLTSILNHEHASLLREASLTQGNKTRVEAIDAPLDVSLFRTEYQNKHFIKPEQIYYENYYNGIYKDVLFGSSLDEYTSSHQRTVPLVVTKCINAVEQMGGLQKEGIYRISGRQTNVDMLKMEFEKNEDTFQPETQYDVFTIASVLKIYLRELVTPLVPYSVSDRLTYSTVQNLQQRLSFLQHKVSELSQSRRDTLEAVVRHLEKVNAHSDTNKMNLQNLSYMFTPAIFHDHNQADHPGEWQSDLVFEDLVLHHDVVFAPIGRKQIQQPQQQQVTTSPTTPLLREQSDDFKRSSPTSDLVSGPIVPSKPTNMPPTSRSRSSTLTQSKPPALPSPSTQTIAKSQPPPPPHSHAPAASNQPTTATTYPGDPSPTGGSTSTIEPIAMNKALSTPSALMTDPAQPSSSSSSSSTVDSPFSCPPPASVPMLTTTSATSSEAPKSHGILRRATLKAKAVIPPRQQSLRLKQGRSPGTAPTSPTTENAPADLPSS